ncbi:MAG: L,D-transpeptidase family protein [Pseudomonadota bacterium]
MTVLTRKVWFLLSILVFSQASFGLTLELPDDGSSIVGVLETAVVQEGETLLDIGRRFGVGYREIEAANPGVDPWVPKVGTEVIVPTRFVLPKAKRNGIVLNIPEMRLYYFPENAPEVVETYPVSIGRMDWKTPLGVTKVVSKVTNPSWYPPKSVRAEAKADGRELPGVVPPGPDNPLGAHAMRLSIPGYLIHGTNRPAGVGMRVTHGCLRMFPEDIASLFQRVPVGTPVRIVNQPFKVGLKDSVLYLEAHTPLEEDKAFQEKGLTLLTEAVVAATDETTTTIDWPMAESVYEQRRGVPYPFSERPVRISEDGSLDTWCDAQATVDLCGDSP